MTRVTLTLLLVVTLALGACGTTAKTTVAQRAKAIATAAIQAQPTTTIAGSPTIAPADLPYTFALAWQRPTTNGPQAVGGYAFAPSAPLVGYACKAFAGSLTTAYHPASPTTPTGAQTALRAPAAEPHSGLPEFSITTDGGDSWQGTRTAPIAGDGPCLVTVDPNDPKDVFVSSGTNNPKQANALLRSRDGGSSWSTLSNISVQGQQPYVRQLALFGTRLIASVEVLCTDSNLGCGSPPPTDNLFASDDSGTTWQQIGQKVAGPGAMLTPFITSGATLFIATQAFTHAATGTRPTLNVPLSSPMTTTYWRSADAGATWTRMDTVPLPLLTFAPVQQTAGYYYALSAGTSNGRVATQFFVSSGTSATVGTSWIQAQPLDGANLSNPAYAGVSGQPSIFSCLITSDGSIITSTAYLDSRTGSYSDGGAFLLRGNTAPSSWRALAPPGVFDWQTTPRGSGFRLWGIRYGTSTTASALVYVDVG